MLNHLLPILYCPETGQPLRLANEAELAKLNAQIQAGNLRDYSGNLIETPLENGFIRQDNLIVYPVCDNIPIIIIEDAIVTRPEIIL